MAEAAFYDRVQVSTSTTGTGSSVAVGSAVPGYLTPAEAGVQDGAVVNYVIEDGDDFEFQIGQTYSSSGPSLSRGTPSLSKISGTVGTSQIELSGNARVAIVPFARDVNALRRIFDTKADIEATEIPASIDAVIAAGYESAGDGFSALFHRASTEPSHAGKIQSADGAWWELPAIDIDVTVGAGGDFTSINDALIVLSQARPTHTDGSITAQITLLSGFTMQEQVVADRVDLGWIKIVAQDATVSISRDSMTSAIYMDRHPAFAALNNGVLPTIAAQFQVSSGTQTNVDGILVANGGKVYVYPGSGVSHADNGIYAINGAMVTFVEPGPGRIWDDRPDFSNATDNGCYCAFGCVLNIVGGDFSNAGGVGVYALSGCLVNAQRVIATGARGDAGIISRDASVVNARASDVSGASGNGYYALHGGVINARYFADVGSNGASNCGANGVRAEQGGYIEAQGIVARNCVGAGVLASYGSTINANGADVSGSDIGFGAEYSSTVCADSGTADGCRIGIFCTHASRIDFNSGSAVNCTGNAISATGVAMVRAASATLTGAADTGLLCQDGSVCDVNGANLSGAGGTGINCRRGGRVSAFNANAQKGASPGTSDIVVTNGGIVAANSATGGTSVTVNTISGAGIIFK